MNWLQFSISYLLGQLQGDHFGYISPTPSFSYLPSQWQGDHFDYISPTPSFSYLPSQLQGDYFVVRHEEYVEEVHGCMPA
jgi:hypothetical protein